jgi:hypothetical protein
MEAPVSASTLAIAVATPVSGAFGFFVRHFFASRDKREEIILNRERTWMATVEARLAKVERAYGVVVGVVHVIVDDLEPGHSSFLPIRDLLKAAFPVTEETPPELLNLIARLDAKDAREKRSTRQRGNGHEN